MKRKKASEKTGRWIRDRIRNELMKLCAEVTVWIEHHENEIRHAYESLGDDSFDGRPRENFASLEAILTVSDPNRLPTLAQVRKSLAVGSEITLSDDSPEGRILPDIRDVLIRDGDPEIPSVQLCEALTKIEGSPWSDYKGKPLTVNRLAALLRPYGILPDRIGAKESQVRGYAVRQFEDAFSRYLSASPPAETVNPSTERINTGENEDFKPSTESPVDTLKNAVSPNRDADGGRVDTLKPRQAERETSSGATEPLEFSEDRDVLEL